MQLAFLPLIAFACLILPALSHAVDTAAIARLGNGKGAAPCMACHGDDGGGQNAAGYPRLAGLDAAYLEKQLEDFASGARVNPVMEPSATALDAGERHALALYYSNLSLPPGLARPVTPLLPADSVGAVLATRGDWDRDVPGCVQCHGPGGVGVGAHFPPLAGQPAAYIKSQLKAWQNGTRHNDPLQLMQHLSASLSAKEINSVAKWFAAQPPIRRGATP
ncbi:MAG: c-type cytochrome [Rhodanobacter sp.]